MYIETLNTLYLRYISRLQGTHRGVRCVIESAGHVCVLGSCTFPGTFGG